MPTNASYLNRIECHFTALRCGECVTGTWPRRLPHTSGTSKLGRLRGRGEQLHKQGWRGLLTSSADRPASSDQVMFLGAAGLPAEVVPTG